MRVYKIRTPIGYRIYAAPDGMSAKRVYAIVQKTFREDEHPRGDDGRFKIKNKRKSENIRQTTGYRRSIFEDITPQEKEYIYSEAEAIGISRDNIVIRQGMGTGYLDSDNKIIVSANVFPTSDKLCTDNNANMSVRAVLAHEWYGHGSYRGTKLGRNKPDDEFRASFTAAILAPALSHKERQSLMQDAIDKARNGGIDWHELPEYIKNSIHEKLKKHKIHVDIEATIRRLLNGF